jgi:predicted DNA-binding transcriptional regulator AlpA
LISGGHDAPRQREYLPARAVRARYGVSAMTIHRWLHNPAVAFPKPLKINSRNYWRMADLEAWEGRQAA